LKGLRQLYQCVATARGHWTIVGTPAQIADQLQLWFENGAADGFNVLPPVLPAKHLLQEKRAKAA